MKPTVTLSIRVDTAEYEKLKAEAEREGIPITTAARRRLIGYEGEARPPLKLSAEEIVSVKTNGGYWLRPGLWAQVFVDKAAPQK